SQLVGGRTLAQGQPIDVRPWRGAGRRYARSACLVRRTDGKARDRWPRLRSDYGGHRPVAFQHRWGVGIGSAAHPHGPAPEGRRLPARWKMGPQPASRSPGDPKLLQRAVKDKIDFPPRYAVPVLGQLRGDLDFTGAIRFGFGVPGEFEHRPAGVLNLARPR